MRKTWNWLLVEDHRKALGFIGAGLAAIVGAAWTVFVYLDTPDPVTPPVDSGQAVTQPAAPSATDSADQELRDRLVGSWSGGWRDYPSNVSLQIRYAFNPNGQYTWIGEGPVFSLIISGEWSVSDGRITTRVTSSNLPQMVPVGSTYSSEILELTSTSYSYIDQVTGRRVTDQRIN